MKYCIVVPDGICDVPHARTKNMTPLEVARTPTMDTISSRGRMGMTETIPAHLPAESAVSTMSILGYDPGIYYNGKAPFEALVAEIPVGPKDWVFTCDFVSTFEGAIVDPRAGQVRTAEAKILIDDLNRHFERSRAHFHLGDSYHHLLVIEDSSFPEVETRNPWGIVGRPFREYYPSGPENQKLIEIMEQAHQLLQSHEINKIRRELSENPADSIWLWGGGALPSMPSFDREFHLSGGIVSAYPEVSGVGKAIGMRVLPVPGATGSWDTDYQAKVTKTLDALTSLDLVYLHLGALMAVSRHGNISQKVRVIEQIDDKVIKPIYQGLPGEGRVMIVAGHFVSIDDKVGSRAQVPFAIWGKGLPGGTDLGFNEKNAARVNLTIAPGTKLLPFLLNL